MLEQKIHVESTLRFLVLKLKMQKENLFVGKKVNQVSRKNRKFVRLKKEKKEREELQVKKQQEANWSE